MRFPVAVAALLFAVAASPAAIGSDGKVIAAVATNFLLPLRALAEEFAMRAGHEVQPVSGSTGQIYAQIVNGAPYDVFLSADAERPRLLDEAGLVAPGTRRTYALGRIVLWSADPARVPTPDGERALEALLAAPDGVRLALANPAVAPYGVAAQETLMHLGLWEQLQKRLVRGINVAQVFQFVGSGNVALGFIARSQLQARPADAPGSIWLVPSGLHGPIHQDVVLLRRAADNDAARAFLDFLAAPDTLRRIESFGYDVVSP